jgi:hypothetical protein
VDNFLNGELNLDLVNYFVRTILTHPTLIQCIGAGSWASGSVLEHLPSILKEAVGFIYST